MPTRDSATRLSRLRDERLARLLDLDRSPQVKQSRWQRDGYDFVYLVTRLGDQRPIAPDQLRRDDVVKLATGLHRVQSMLATAQGVRVIFFHDRAPLVVPSRSKAAWATDLKSILDELGHVQGLMPVAAGDLSERPARNVEDDRECERCGSLAVECLAGCLSRRRW
ncbi:hypothetical protein ACFWAP_00720 [Streptomyces goshikiensis]|uniref:hypothetical protein n=1 Tax=Streptomyces goshikiensis TaxID=1942 RepID=UPI00366283D9